MPFSDLRSFISALEARGELRRIREPLSLDLEVAAAARITQSRGGPALLFESLRESPGWRMVSGIFGSRSRLELALGARVEEVASRLAEVARIRLPEGLGGKIRALARLASLGSYAPKYTSKPSFAENVVEGGEVNVEVLPAVRCWPRDGGRYFTFAQVYLVEPSTGSTTTGTYRVMVRGPRELVIHWQLHKRGRMAELEAREELRVAVVLGGDPAAMLASCLPVPRPLDKLLFAGMLAGRGVEVYKLPSGVPVPAHAEAVIEAVVEPGRLSWEGPFGDHFGVYDSPRRGFPVARVERVWWRSNPIAPFTVVGFPGAEDEVIGWAAERLAVPLLRLILPEVVDIHLPPSAGFHGVAVVSIRKAYPGHGKKVLMALWGLGLLSLTKVVIVVDEWVDPRDWGEVLRAIALNVDPQRDVVVVPSAPLDELDPAASTPGLGGKLGVDATRKVREELGREPPEPLEPSVEVDARVLEVLRRAGVV